MVDWYTLAPFTDINKDNAHGFKVRSIVLGAVLTATLQPNFFLFAKYCAGILTFHRTILMVEVIQSNGLIG